MASGEDLKRRSLKSGLNLWNRSGCISAMESVAQKERHTLQTATDGTSRLAGRQAGRQESERATAIHSRTNPMAVHQRRIWLVSSKSTTFKFGVRTSSFKHDLGSGCNEYAANLSVRTRSNLNRLYCVQFLSKALLFLSLSHTMRFASVGH